MMRWTAAAAGTVLVLASAASYAQTATSSATLNTQAGTATSSDEALPQAPAVRSAPSRPSRPMEASAPGSTTAPMATTGAAMAPADPAAARADSIGGSGSAGLAAMGGGIDTSAYSGTGTMGAGGNLMPDCPTGFVRYLGLCVTHAQAKQAQRPNKPPKPQP